MKEKLNEAECCAVIGLRNFNVFKLHDNMNTISCELFAERIPGVDVKSATNNDNYCHKIFTNSVSHLRRIRYAKVIT